MNVFANIAASHSCKDQILIHNTELKHQTYISLPQ